jgi:hypothetical protein
MVRCPQGQHWVCTQGSQGRERTSGVAFNLSGASSGKFEDGHFVGDGESSGLLHSHG